MKYDFDEIIDRTGTDSIKWAPQVLKERFGSENVVPMWIADMDFRSPQPIVDAIIRRAQHGIFGYGHRSDEYLQIAVDWQRKRNGWKLEKEWLLFTPGIIPALNFILQTFCLPGDKVVLQTPVYYPFANIVHGNGCHIVENQLIYQDGRYSMDYDGLEKIVQDTKVKMIFLCSPHNPVGRVWTREELTRLGEICIKNGVLIASDEIHSDLIYSGNKHIPFASISDEFAMNSFICTAPTKTFNLAGLHISNIIVKNKKLRNELEHRLSNIDIDPSSFATVAHNAAYSEGEEWLEQLLDYLQGNIYFIENFLCEKMSEVKLVKPEGTYLAWLDFKNISCDSSFLESLMLDKARVALDEGYIFGSGGEGFERINFACPRSILEKGLSQIEKAVHL